MMASGSFAYDSQEKRMKRTTPSIIAACIAAAFAMPATPVLAQHSHSAPAADVKIQQTGAALRDLWIGHIFWVRNVAIHTLSGDATAAGEAEKQAVANARQIAAAIEPYYGKEASEKLFGLLAGHYNAVKHYLQATVAGSKTKQDTAVQALTANARDIATFLSKANPNLPFDTLNGLLVAHGGHHIQEIEQLRAKQYAEEAQTWEAMKKHMYAISDALAGALAKQFPGRVS
jgi:hypothetical protein